jgi:hypothetical protein
MAFDQHNMFNLYQEGKKAEDIVAFVRTKTGFDVRSCASSLKVE